MPKGDKHRDKPPTPQPLFGDDEAGTGGASITVNKSFAKSFEEKKRKQELTQARDRGLFDALKAAAAVGGSDEESEDEGAALTTTLERKIQETISLIRSKDPRIYSKDVKFFDSGKEADAAEQPAPAEPKKKGKKATDVIREQLQAAAEEGRSDAFDEDDQVTLGRRVDEGDRRVGHRVYDDEQAQLRGEFLATVAQQSNILAPKVKGAGGRAALTAPLPTPAAASDDEDGDDGLLQVKQRREEEEDAEDDRASVVSVDRERVVSLMRTRDGRLAEHGHDIRDPDQFLDAFIGSRAWRAGEMSDGEEEEEEGGASGGRVPVRVPETGDGPPSELDDADADALDQADKYEAEYNFRYEEPGGGAIVSHARNVDGTLRRKEDKRKQGRDRKKERKEAARVAAEAEMRRLMNLKRAEHSSQLGVLKDVAGLDSDKLAAVLGDDLDKEWDPAAHDAAMAALFSDEYYGEVELEAEPHAASARARRQTAEDGAGDAEDEDDVGRDGGEDEEEEAGSVEAPRKKKKARVPAWVYGDGPRPKWAGPSAEDIVLTGDDGFAAVAGEDEGKYDDGGEEGEEEEEEEEEEEAEGGDEQDAHDPAVHGRRRGRREGKRKKAAKKRMGFLARVKTMLAADAKAVRDGTSVGHGGVHPDDPADVLELGFEDVIAGGIKTRFKYTAVEAEDFGLADEELLLADDADLNTYVSLKKLAPYRDKPWVVASKKRKRDLQAIREKVRQTVEDLGLNKPNVAGGAVRQEEAEREKRKGKHRAHARDEEEAAVDSASGAPALAVGEVEAGEAEEVERAAAGHEGGKRKRKRKHKSKGEGEQDGDALEGGVGLGARGTEEEPFVEAQQVERAMDVEDADTDAAPAGTRERRKHKEKHKQHKGDTEEGQELVQAPGGGMLKKSRLATYGVVPGK